jgi:hypothetical protein
VDAIDSYITIFLLTSLSALVILPSSTSTPLTDNPETTMKYASFTREFHLNGTDDCRESTVFYDFTDAGPDSVTVLDSHDRDIWDRLTASGREKALELAEEHWADHFSPREEPEIHMPAFANGLLAGIAKAQIAGMR